MGSVVWEMEEALGSALEVCLDCLKTVLAEQVMVPRTKSIKSPSFPMVSDGNTNGNFPHIRCGILQHILFARVQRANLHRFQPYGRISFFSDVCLAFVYRALAIEEGKPT